MSSSVTFGKPSFLSWRAAATAVSALSSCTAPSSCMFTSAQEDKVSLSAVMEPCWCLAGSSYVQCYAEQQHYMTIMPSHP